MGARLSSLDSTDGRGPGDKVEFFRSVKVRWVDYFVCRLRENLLCDVSLEDTSNVIQWREYFKIFTDVKTFSERDEENRQRMVWHPATSGFMMQRDYGPVTEADIAGIPDDFTEDEATDDEEEKADDAENIERQSSEQQSATNEGSVDETGGRRSTNASARPPKEWDPTLVSPIFFGYSTLTQAEYKASMEDAKQFIKDSEHRAVEAAKMSRVSAIEELEAQCKGREAARLKKISDMEAAYNAAAAKREEELNRNKKNLPDLGFRMYKAQWDKEYEAAEAAYETEISNLRSIHYSKTEADREMLQKRREDVEAFKDAEHQEIPAAERLEEIAKLEISRWIDELETQSGLLDVARQEYQKLRGDFAKVQNNRTKAMEMRPMINIAETKVRECQRRVEDALGSLSDAETLLDRAVRMKSQQDSLLPLFQMIARSEKPKECPLNLFIVAMVALAVGTIDQKLATLLHNFDKDKTGFFDFTFIKRVVLLFHEALYRIDIIPFAPIPQEVHGLIERAYIDHDLPFTGLLTQYETKQLFVSMIEASGPLTEYFGVARKMRFSTYQRNNMSAISLLRRCHLTPSAAYYRNHFDLIKYRAVLEPGHMAVIHDRAMAMGNNDPLKTDYTSFLKKPKKAGVTEVKPLEHGHLTNMKYYSDKIRHAAACRIQAVLRAHRDRHHAAREATKAAIRDAKALAMTEMKEKVLKEFQKREASEGNVKAKWDAAVRMRQAKLRSSGQNLSRADVVMVMMEEAMQRAKEDIEVRFRKIEAAEGIEAQKDDDALSEDNDEKEVSIFGMFRRDGAAAGGSALLDDIGDGDDQGPEQQNEEENEDEVEIVEDGSISTKSGKAPKMSEEERRMRDMVEGRYYHLLPGAKGETLADFEFRLAMTTTDPTPEHWAVRLHTIDKSFTQLKVEDFLAELPTKRLLMKFLEVLTLDHLIRELKNHFKLARRYDTIALALKSVSCTDKEFGLLRAQLMLFKEAYEAGLRSLVRSENEDNYNLLVTLIDRRLANSDGRITEMEIIDQEADKVAGNLRRVSHTLAESAAAMQRLREKTNKLMQSHTELKRKETSLTRLVKTKRGSEVDPLQVEIADRYGWSRRVNAAMDLPTDTPAAMQVKYRELRAVCKEFLDVATFGASIIIQEHFLPKHLKTIPVKSEREIDGRSDLCGRGIDGKSYIYEMHNIIYHVCLDDDGVFNGSDEFAAKAGGKERLGALEYFKCHIQRLNVPLVSTIDYFGYRVVAVSKQPTDIITFSEEGDVRKVTEELVHGITHGGDLFVNKSKTLVATLNIASLKLNLAEHSAKGMQDISSSKTCCSAELKVYRGSDGQYYMKDFWRSFPSELPESTPHLLQEARGQSIYWRQLRPEFCKRYRIPLSADAACGVVYGVPDAQEHYAALMDACNHLIQTVIPKYAEALCSRSFSAPLAEGLGIDFSTELHDQGINVRHLGYLRSLLWHKLPGTATWNFNEKFLRTTHDWREEVTDGEHIRINDKFYQVKETAKRKITFNRVPLDTVQAGMSIRNTAVYSGKIESDGHSDELRSVMLAEMTVRVIKNIIRLHLRRYVAEEHCCSSEFMRSVISRYFNVITGSDPDATSCLHEDVFEGIRARFGTVAVTPNERSNIQTTLRPCSIYMIRRLQSMLGVHIVATTVAEFLERPDGFTFVPMDIREVAPKVRHNIPVMSFADALLASLKAQELQENSYRNQVLLDEPPLCLLLSERRGCRVAENLGTLGKDFNAKYSVGCVLEEKGPVSSDPFIRAVGLSAAEKTHIDTRYNNLLVPCDWSAHFSVSLFVQCTGGENMHRVVMQCGRYAIVITRDNNYVFILYERGIHQLNILIGPAAIHEWVHIVATYDGTTVRIYVDSYLKVSVEVEAAMQRKIQNHMQLFTRQRAEIMIEESKSKDVVKAESQKEAEEFFASKEGQRVMKDASRTLFRSPEFQAENFGEGMAESKEIALKLKKEECMRRVKSKHAAEIYVRNVKKSADAFKQMYEDLEDRIRRDEERSAAAAKKPLRIGASNTSLSAKDGKSYFTGMVSCVMVFDKCLSMDRVKSHYLSLFRASIMEAQRLHAVASSLYEDAMLFSADDPLLLRNYAASLCEYLKIELTSQTAGSISRGKAKLMDAIKTFRDRMIPLGIAEIIRSLPPEIHFAELVSVGFLAIQSIDSHFFAVGEGLSRQDLVTIPKKFGLDLPNSPAIYTEAAAGIYQEVVLDPKLSDVYGDTKLTWVKWLVSAALVVAIVTQVQEDPEAQSVCVGKMFQSAATKRAGGIKLIDEDLKVMCENMRLLTTIDVANCTQLTDRSIADIASLKYLRVLNLDYCTGISDDGLEDMKNLADSLEILSMQGIRNLTDDGICVIGQNCRLLTSLNISHCSQVTHVGVIAVAQGCKKLRALYLSSIPLSDMGFATMVPYLSKRYMEVIDISNCRDITDHGVSTLAEQCSRLTYLNMSGVSRVTDRGVQKICSNCWRLEHLLMEDVFLLEDAVFWYDHAVDGRVDADEKMLKSLITLNLKDCVHVTDDSIAGLSKRCARIESLNLQGCHLLTDEALLLMSTATLDSVNQQFPMCDSFKFLNIAYCSNLTAYGLMRMFPLCGVLEKLDVSGLTCITDDVILDICHTCPTIQDITLHRCAFVTDAALCSIARHLWVERIDISNCSKITDTGVEVLAAACSGLVSIALRRLKRVTNKSLNLLAAYCKLLVDIDVRECENIDIDCVRECAIDLPKADIRSDFENELNTRKIDPTRFKKLKRAKSFGGK